jgi:hypothetical protein
VRASEKTLEDIRARVAVDTPYFARTCVYIVTKQRKIQLLEPKLEQLRFDEVLEAQRRAGLPQRALICKARQIGYSTWTQAKMMQRATQWANQECLTVAHDRETGGKLFRMGELIYQRLPTDPELGIKPALKNTQRNMEMVFGEPSAFKRAHGEIGMNSRYLVDTAGEFQAGRGGTYSQFHGSEVAFWPDIDLKLMGVLEGLPDDPETMAVLESTPNGMNTFKDLWDDAVAGRSEFAAFFSPWFKEPSYTRPFASEGVKEDFILKVGAGPYGEDEPMLLELFKESGIEDPYERLNWRRAKIASPSMKGDLAKFHQEYASTAEEAFMSTGKKVFAPITVSRVIRATERFDPRQPSDDLPGPRLGTFEVVKKSLMQGRHGRVEYPSKWEWKPKGFLDDPDADSVWRVWEEPTKDGQYVIGVDPSEGDDDTEKGESAWMGVEVVNHETLQQVAEFRTRMDAHLVAEQVYMAGRHWNQALIAVERTGGYGQQIAETIYHDWKWLRPRMYHSRPVGDTKEKERATLGWQTTRATKGALVAHGQELLHDDAGDVDSTPTMVRSRLLADEFSTYVRNDRGKMMPDTNKFADLLMAFLIAEYVAYQVRPRTRRDKAGPVNMLSEAARERWMLQ